MNLLPTVLLSALIAGPSSFAPLPVPAVADSLHAVAPIPNPTLSMNITLDKSITITGSGYPANTSVTITLTNLTHPNSTTVVKTTDGNGNLQPGGNPVGTLTAQSGDTIQASTPAPNEATTTAVVPTPGVTERLVGLFRIIIDIIVPG